MHDDDEEGGFIEEMVEKINSKGYALLLLGWLSEENLLSSHTVKLAKSNISHYLSNEIERISDQIQCQAKTSVKNDKTSLRQNEAVLQPSWPFFGDDHDFRKKANGLKECRCGLVDTDSAPPEESKIVKQVERGKTPLAKLLAYRNQSKKTKNAKSTKTSRSKHQTNSASQRSRKRIILLEL